MASTLETAQSGYAKILKNIEAASEESRLSNLSRYEQGLAIYDEIINRYQTGGAFQQLGLAEIEKQKKREVGQLGLSAISRGLANVQGFGPAELGAKWERETGAGMRLRLEDLLMQRLSEAQIGKASFMERRTDEYPDLGLASQLASQGYTAGYTYGTGIPGSRAAKMWEEGATGGYGVGTPPKQGTGATIVGSELAKLQAERTKTITETEMPTMTTLGTAPSSTLAQATTTQPITKPTASTPSGLASLSDEEIRYKMATTKGGPIIVNVYQKELQRRKLAKSYSGE